MSIFLSPIFYLLFLFILVLSMSICFSFFLVLSKKARHQVNMSGSNHIRLEHGLRLIRLNFKEGPLRPGPSLKLLGLRQGKESTLRLDGP